ncbi:MAG: dTDP-4-dehydrorhamnose reductase family protein [Gammaproteobacteria bacterium]
MRILILGGDGMLGHQLLKTLDQHTTYVTLRQELSCYQSFKIFTKENSFPSIDIRRFDDLIDVFNVFKPQAVINAIGIVKQRSDAKQSIPSLEINALFPHRLANLCSMINARMIHISTDCVFSGEKGQYTEDDPMDARDLYGQSKFLGEVHDNHCVTLRSSIIGLELSRKTSLIEWFLAQKGSISGYRRAIYTGITTAEMSRLIENILLNHSELSGLWHVASTPINKFDLLKMLAEKLPKNDVIIQPDDQFFCDRSLIGTRLQEAINYIPPTWHDMLTELANEITNR